MSYKVDTKGRRTDNGLWSILLVENKIKQAAADDNPKHPIEHVANGVIKLDLIRSKLVQYYAIKFYNPTQSTLMRAIRNNHLITWPPLTAALVHKHFPDNILTAQGRLE